MYRRNDEGVRCTGVMMKGLVYRCGDEGVRCTGVVMKGLGVQVWG